jgi:hypothetical protein
MEGPTSSCGLRSKITFLNLHEHDDDNEDKSNTPYIDSVMTRLHVSTSK